MTILADFQIRKLCTPPTFMVTERINPLGELCAQTFDINWTPECVTRLSYLTEDELITGKYSNDEDELGIISYRKLTDEEIAAYKPMISPYVPGQVRIKELETLEEFYTRMSDLIHALPEDHIDKGREVLRICWDGDIIDGEEVKQKIEKLISYGTSSFGYDVRIANEFKIFTNINSTVINPKDFNEKSFVDFVGDVCIIPPNSFVLARSVEYFTMPDDVTGLVLGKSTYARTGISCLATPLECGWEGHITLEFANTTPLPSMLFANEGAAQVLFFKGSQSAEVTYASRKGKYNKQRGITLPKA